METSISSVCRAIGEATHFLQDCKIASPRLTAEVLLAFVLQKDRTWLVIHSDFQLENHQLVTFQDLLDRCAKHEPVAYLVGEKEFFSRSFAVCPSVLIPRPETEELVELILTEFSCNMQIRFLDIGTGSGAIAVTLAAELPKSFTVALDICPQALAVAAKNARKNGVAGRLSFCRATLFSLPFVADSFDCIVSNPPYISQAEFVGLEPTVAEFEPHLALVSGQSGLECYEVLSREAFGILRRGGIFFAEIGWQQKNAILEIFSHWQKVEVLADLAGKDRFLLARK